MRRIVFSGGTFSGKSSTLNLFKNSTFEIIEEESIKQISILNKKYGIDGQKKWLMNNYAQFQISVANNQIKNERKNIRENFFGRRWRSRKNQIYKS